MTWWLAAAAWAGVVDRIAAVVNEEVVTLSEIYDVGAPYIQAACDAADVPCVEAAEQEVLDSLIRRSLIRQELGRLDLQVTAADVDEAIDRTIREYQMADRAELRAEVERSGKRWDQYREEIFEFLRSQNFQGRVLAPRVAISEDELRDLYQRSTRREVKQEVRLSALGVVIPLTATADETDEMWAQTELLVNHLNTQRISWTEAVEKYDGANLSEAIGGRFYKSGELLDAIEAVAFSPTVVPGQALAPVRVNNVLAVVRVDERRQSDGALLPFEQVRGELRNKLFMEKLELAEEEWYLRARRQAAIRVLIGEKS